MSESESHDRPNRLSDCNGTGQRKLIRRNDSPLTNGLLALAQLPIRRHLNPAGGQFRTRRPQCNRSPLNRRSDAMSSSERRTQQHFAVPFCGPCEWPTILSCALVLAVAFVAATEVLWRQMGHFPTVYNSPGLWAYHRRQLIRNGPNGVALLGSSRMLAGFSTDAFRTRFPDRYLAQLAIQGSSPVKAFED